MPSDLALALAISAGAGVLIGLERQYDARSSGEGDAAVGVRTFTLWALLGTLAAYLQDRHAPGFFPAAFLVLATVAGCLAFLPASGARPFGITTLSASLLVFVIGGLTWWGPKPLAVAAAVFVAILLHAKPLVHAFGGKLTGGDWNAALKFAAVTALILPWMPNTGYGPFEAFNPRSIWLMVILVSGIGFIGYLASRIAGERAGLAMTGIVGGLVSSTAATIAFTRHSKEYPAASRDCAIGIALACTVMLGRTAALVAALHAPLLAKSWPGLAAMAIPGIIVLGPALRLPSSVALGDSSHPHRPANPLGLGLAIKFALLFALIVLASRAAAHHFGEAGIPWVALFSGLTDMDAIAISLAQLASDTQLAAGAAARCIWIAACANTALKWIFAIAGGSKALRLPVSLFMAATLSAGTGCVFFLRL